MRQIEMRQIENQEIKEYELICVNIKWGTNWIIELTKTMMHNYM